MKLDMEVTGSCFLMFGHEKAGANHVAGVCLPRPVHASSTPVDIPSASLIRFADSTHLRLRY